MNRCRYLVAVVLLLAPGLVRGNDAKLTLQWVYADLVFRGEVLKVGRCGQCSDFGVVYQPMRFRVREVFKDTLHRKTPRKVRVAEGMWEDRDDVLDCCLDVQRGSEVIVFAQWFIDQLENIEVSPSVLPLTESTVALLRRLRDCEPSPDGGLRTRTEQAAKPLPWEGILAEDRLSSFTRTPSPHGKRVLIVGVDEVGEDFMRTFVGDSAGACPPIYLSGRNATAVGERWLFSDVGSRGAMWLDPDRVAFLDCSGSEEHVFVADLKGGETRAWRVNGVPLRLRCEAGQLTCETEGGCALSVGGVACTPTAAP